MKLRPLDPYALCGCGSGKKYKFCCRPTRAAAAKGQFHVEGEGFPPGLVVGGADVEASLIFQQELPLPQFYLTLARAAAADAESAQAGPRVGLEAIQTTTLAAEAIVNRLLEPLVRADQWSGARGLERDKPAAKWERLGRELRLDPPLHRTTEPLSKLVELFALRNELTHFKHGPNMTRHEGPATKGVARRGRLEVDVADLRGPLETLRPKFDLRDALEPRHAGRYLDALASVLRVVLPHYPDDPFTIRDTLLYTLDAPLEELATQE